MQEKVVLEEQDKKDTIEKLNNLLRRNITYTSEHRNQIKQWLKKLEKSE